MIPSSPCISEIDFSGLILLSQQCILMANKSQQYPGLMRPSIASRLGKGDPALLSTGEAMWRVLYPVLGSPVQEGHGLAGVRPAQGHKD